MNVYLLVHRQPRDYVSNEDTSAQWIAWFKQLGAAVVDLGNPVLDGRDEVGETGKSLPLGGYTLIRAQNANEATKLASGCPIVKEGGGVEIGRLTPIPGRKHPERVF
jgi:hypothetical protein